MDAKLGGLFERVQWVNLGGGYLLDETDSLEPLCETIRFLRSRYGLEVFVEPGAALARAAGQIVSTVLDVFESGGKKVAVLDTTVNHMPEVFEYGFEPDVLGHDDGADHEYLLAGCTCLAGDLFGLYQFHEPLEAGSQVVFNNAGAYTLPKAHMFNGVNLPTIYAVSESGDLVLKKRFTYAEYAAKWGENVAVPV
jgi:carboxynorspermidine decarboxylase